MRYDWLQSSIGYRRDGGVYQAKESLLKSTESCIGEGRGGEGRGIGGWCEMIITMITTLLPSTILINQVGTILDCEQ